MCTLQDFWVLKYKYNVLRPPLYQKCPRVALKDETEVYPGVKIKDRSQQFNNTQL